METAVVNPERSSDAGSMTPHDRLTVIAARAEQRRGRVEAVMGWTPPRRPWCARVVLFVTTESGGVRV